jgi:hypothetical protein
MTADELRCPRCGAYFQEDRRVAERRKAVRRENPPADPGPPGAATKGDAKPIKGATGEGAERRQTDRRSAQRRGGKPPLPGAAEDTGGWRD